MPTIGTLAVTTFRTQADQTDYALPGNTVSSTNLVALRRQLPVKKGEDLGVLRANTKVTKSFPVGDTTKEVTFNFSGVIPVGVVVADVLAFMTSTVDKIVTGAEVRALMSAGDINVSD